MTIDATPDALRLALPLAKGCYQRNLLHGWEALSGATLKGKASRYGGRDHGKRILVLRAR